MSRSKVEFRRAQRVMPGGVNSPVRAFKTVGGTPRIIQRASGCSLTDVDGISYVDYIGSWGSMIAGHAHPAVAEAVARTARDGLSFGVASVLETQLAEEIIDRVPSIERVRMVNSGTEAVMSAVRLARAATGRNKIIKFAGGYHGHSDSLLVKAGSGAATLSLPDSPGVTRGATQDTLIALYNDADSVRDLFLKHGDDIAAILIEPIAGNMGVVPPREGFLAALRPLADKHGALLIFDEVMTGFRVSRGGAQGLYSITPDLTTLGKVLGGGLPIGAYGGRAKYMDMVAPAGPVYQAGTFSGNPVTMAAGLATLSLLDNDAYRRLEAAGAHLEAGLRQALDSTDQRASVQRVGSMLTVFFGAERVEDLADAESAAHDTFAWFFNGLLARGIHLPPSGYESWFISLAHTESVIDHTTRAAREALTELRWAATPIGL
jgi:glutamate-1-semialdehyde 2,1-aminomutase